MRVAGWLHKKRDHGGLLFVDLRDHTGLLQCVVEEGSAPFNVLDKASLESVIQLEGVVLKRADDVVNTALETGTIELKVAYANILSKADPLPLSVNSDDAYPEETRLKYRFLDLRRDAMQKKLILRSQVIQTLRTLMTERGFLDIQTPILTASSPEGARDFLVPSRLNPGHFYALPQAPQQFKQLLMASGVHKYFQIAPCFRDEDARRDRSPGDFYQLDLEMAFATQEDVFNVLEDVLFALFQKFAKSAQITKPAFPRIPYKDAMLAYGSDKPDLRNPLRIQEASSLFEGTGFNVFLNAIAKGASVRAIKVGNIAQKSRKFFDELTAYMLEQGAGGLAYVLLTDDDNLKGPLSRFFADAKKEELKKTFSLEKGDGVFFICEKPQKAATLAGTLRTHLGETLDLLEKNAFRFCWVVDFPMYEKDEDTGNITFSHNPFSMPQGGMEALCTQDPLTIKAFQYDIVVNGVELSSGAIRNHLPEVMVKAFSIAGYTEKDVKERFGALYRAFHYGVPPHGGAAPGIDRIVMLLADEDNLREVIAFPLNQKGQDPLMGAPAPADTEHLKTLGLKTLA